jgi:catechol 2,3-dioxygenase-like lactoylglutathione lyase family enzyme
LTVALSRGRRLRPGGAAALSGAMKFEHFALNVPDALAMTRWYAEHLGLSVLRQKAEVPYTTFLGDDTGRVFFEIYSNPAAPWPDHGADHPLVFHVAFFTRDAKAEAARLIAAGARAFAEETLPDGSVLVFVRDPWGLAVQLCQRAQPFAGF